MCVTANESSASKLREVESGLSTNVSSCINLWKCDQLQLIYQLAINTIWITICTAKTANEIRSIKAACIALWQSRIHIQRSFNLRKALQWPCALPSAMQTNSHANSDAHAVCAEIFFLFLPFVDFVLFVVYFIWLLSRMGQTHWITHVSDMRHILVIHAHALATVWWQPSQSQHVNALHTHLTYAQCEDALIHTALQGSSVWYVFYEIEFLQFVQIAHSRSQSERFWSYTLNCMNCVYCGLWPIYTNACVCVANDNNDILGSLIGHALMQTSQASVRCTYTIICYGLHQLLSQLAKRTLIVGGKLSGVYLCVVYMYSVYSREASFIGSVRV